MDAMRKQLDVLTGANSNGDVREVNRKYFDCDVCRLFLAGLCPHDLFQLTKMDLGPCPKIHSLQLWKDYEEVKEKGSENFDRELEDMIDEIVEWERKIQRAIKCLDDEDAKAAIAISVSDVTEDEEVVQLSKEIKEKMKEVDTFDFEGKTDDKIKAMEVVEELRSKRAGMQATLLLDDFNKDHALIPQPAPTQIAPLPPPPPPDARTQELINETLSKAEALGQQGMVEEAQKALEEAETLKKLAASRQELASDPSIYTVADVRILKEKFIAALSRRRASSSALPDELVEEILLRLPPDDPASFLRASSVCKSWRSMISRTSFCCRLYELHQTAPVLGFLHDWYNPVIPHFIPTTSSPFSLATPDRRFWRALDCRHGRAIFLSKGQDARDLLVWEPITGAHRRVPVPTAFKCGYPTAAVFCAANGCDHHGCHGGLFCIVFIFTISIHDEFDTFACVYSSETGTWGELTSMHCEFCIVFTESSSVLVGGTLLYFISDSGVILEYDLARHILTSIDTPDQDPTNGPSFGERFNLMLTEDGGLGLIADMDPHLKLWSWNAHDGAKPRWLLSRVIFLGTIAKIGCFLDTDSVVVMLGFAEGANVIFLNTAVGLFTMELQSERVRKVCDDRGICNLIPVVSFYTPMFHGEHQDTTPLNPIEEAAGDEWGGESENALQPRQKVIEDGSIDSNKSVVTESASKSCSSTEVQDEDVAIAAVIDAAEVKWEEQPFKRRFQGRQNGHGPLDREAPPPGYTCFRCRTPGHFIHHCPTIGDPKFDHYKGTRDYINTQSKCICGVKVLADDLIPNHTLRSTIGNRLGTRASSTASGTGKHKSSSGSNPDPKLQSPTTSAASGKDMKQYMDHLPPSASPGAGVVQVAREDDHVDQQKTKTEGSAGGSVERAVSIADPLKLNDASESILKVAKTDQLKKKRKKADSTNKIALPNNAEYGYNVPYDPAYCNPFNSGYPMVTDPYLYSSMDPFGVNPFGNMPLQGPFGIPQGPFGNMPPQSPFGNMPPQALAMQADYQSRETHPAHAEAAPRSRQASHRDTEAAARSRHASHRDADAAVRSRQTEDTGSRPLPSECSQRLGSPHGRESRSRSLSRSERRDHGRSVRASNDTRSERRDHGRSVRASNDTRSERRDHGRSDRASIDTRSEMRDHGRSDRASNLTRSEMRDHGRSDRASNLTRSEMRDHGRSDRASNLTRSEMRDHGRSDRASNLTRSEMRDHGRSDRAPSDYAEDNHSRKRMRASSPADGDKQSRWRSKHSSRSLARDDSSDDEQNFKRTQIVSHHE